MTSVAVGCAALAFAHPDHPLARVLPLAQIGHPATAGDVTAPRGDAKFSATFIDAKTGRPTPVRVRITDASGKPLGPVPLSLPPSSTSAPEARLSEPGSVIGLPKEAIAVMHGPNDIAVGYGFQANGAFFVSGTIEEMPMPAGTFWITLQKGYEFLEQSEEITFKPGEHVKRRYELKRWVDMPARGWYSADDHIHLRRSARENPLILDWIAAEDVHVGVLVQMGDFWTTYFTQYAFGKRGLYARGNHLLTSGQEEPRTHELGHTISFGAEQFVRFQSEYYSYDKVFDRVHQLGGVSGYAHQVAMMFQGYRGMALDALAGKIDFLELMQLCAQKGPLVTEHYYRFLDLGCKVTALGGSDFPWCGRGMRVGEEQVGPRIGEARFYTYVGGELNFDRWLAGIKAGRTFATTGPIVELTVNGHLPGSTLDVKPGTKLRIVAKAQGHATQVPLQRLQIIGHSQVLREVRAGAPGQAAGELALELELTPKHGVWLAARVDAGPTQIAHTTPVYVTVNGDGFHTRTNLDEQIDITRKHLGEIRDVLIRAAGPAEPQDRRATPLPWRYPGGTARLEQRVAETERKLEELRRRR